MTDTLIDANVLIDIFAADPAWKDWSKRQVTVARRDGTILLNQVVYAEVASMFPTQRSLDEALGPAGYKRENLPWDAAFGAARAYLAYRREGGVRRSPLPDFYIGAHADLRGYALLTRDARRYRGYFPTLRIIAPDTHP